MIKYLKQYRFYIILFLFLLIPIIAIDTATRSPRNYWPHDRAIISLTAPIQSVISWGLDLLVSGFQNYVFLLHTRQDNLLLTDENRKLLNTIAGLRETEQENMRLRKLLNFQEQFTLESVVARVIARDVSTEFRAIRINRGESSGIQKNMPVVTNEGIVGKVLRTTANSADVVTVMDLLSAVDAIDERSRARGVIEGYTDDTCLFRYVLRTDDIQVGDILISGGVGGIFPKGIPVALVSKVNRKPFGISQDVEVKPIVDFSKLEEVMVVTKAEHVPLPQEPTVRKATSAKLTEKGETPTESKGTAPPASTPSGKPAPVHAQ
ncbi:MAG TPA: rod shape-determining protein MreC [Bdellovibrionales bacterium]|nr:MAG: rod shape-determining protein MreC [Bdellovibrionales bacterium GWB1_52_6]OFZ06322.1 MAG: rod shape-determining protein MreC [Bdellovibrionales bacterium GWA1_52_35]HAR42019.1 rod shape-determining protein MreC [Bdellovibrionales bacterium]HCM40073.1 rod shape-determining protein MreC [Bdellovibrionales bacterium]